MRTRRANPVILWGRGFVLLALAAFLLFHATGDVAAQRLLVDWIIPATAVVVIALAAMWQRRHRFGDRIPKT